MRLFLLILGLFIYGCNDHSTSEGKIKNDTSKIVGTTNQHIEFRKPYASFNEFSDSIRGIAITQSPVKITNLTVRKVSSDTTVYSFSFSGKRFKCTSILTKKDSDEACDSLFSYYFTINDKIILAKSLPDSLRNQGFKSDKLCGFALQFDRARKFELNGVTYLLIPSSTSECIGGFCNNEIDHLFAIREDSVTYLTVDGWQISDVKHDNQIDQIVFNDDPIQQYSFIQRFKKGHNKDTLSVVKCANVQIWTFNNIRWVPLCDQNNNPYYIFLHFDHMYAPDTYEVLDYNWVKKIER